MTRVFSGLFLTPYLIELFNRRTYFLQTEINKPFASHTKNLLK